MKKDLYKLGIIELNNNVFVSDPCYSVGTWCQAYIQGLKPGKYHGFMYEADTDWDRRVTDLWIVHEDNLKAFPRTLVKDIDIGVDSGGAGIFDEEYYEKYHTRNKKTGEFNKEHDEWYDKQFDLRYYYDKNGNKLEEHYDRNTGRFVRNGEPANGISLDGKCVVSFAGYGDGSYNLYESRNSKDQVVGLRIKFI